MTISTSDDYKAATEQSKKDGYEKGFIEGAETIMKRLEEIVKNWRASAHTTGVLDNRAREVIDKCADRLVTVIEEIRDNNV